MEWQLQTTAFASVDEIIPMKATEQHLPVVLFNILYKVVLTFECVDEILKYGGVYYAVKGIF